MTRTAFRQADIERILRAAKATGASVQIDLKTLTVTVLPRTPRTDKQVVGFATDGLEDWSDCQEPRKSKSR